MMKIVSIGLFAAMLLVAGQGPVYSQENIGDVIARKGLSKLISPGARKTIRADLTTLSESYDSAHGCSCNCRVEGSIAQIDGNDGCMPRSQKTSHKTTGDKLELKGLSLDDLYRLLGERYEFYIDDEINTATINGKVHAIIKFEPKKDLAQRTASDQFINRVSGNIYVDLDGFYISSIEGAAKEPFYFNYRFLGIFPIRVDVYRFEFSVEFMVFNEMAVEKKISGLADYEVRNRITEKFINDVSNYRIR